MKLARYQCHKQVCASKVTRMDIDHHTASVHLFLEDGVVIQSFAWYERHKPNVGGYYVVYDDGYASHSPGDVFESGYTRMEA